MKSKSNKDIIELKKHIFSHLQQIPSFQLTKATVLISYTDDHKDAFEKITGFNRTSTFNLPKMIILKDSSKIIDPTDAILKSQLEIQFVTMRYLLKTITQIKFVFTFDAYETTKKPIENIKKMAIKFLSLFGKLNGETLRNLARSCCILITSTDHNHTIKTYKERIVGQNYDNGILEQGYISKDYENEIDIVFRDIFQDQRVILCSKKQQKSIIDSYINMNNRLKSFHLKHQYLNNEPIYSYCQYARAQPWKEWEELFKLICDNLDSIVTKKPQAITNMKKQLPQMLRNQKNKSQALKKHGTIIIQKILQQFIMKFDNSPPKSSVFKYEFQHLLHLVYEMYRIFEVQKMCQLQLRFQQNRNMMVQFVDALYQSGYISSIIRYYFKQYVTIYSFLSQNSDDNDDLFHKIYFFSFVQKLYSNIKIIIQYFFQVIDQQIQLIPPELNFKNILQQINAILFIGKEQAAISFSSSIIVKKFKKQRFAILYKWFSFTKKSNKKSLITKLVLLLEYSLDIQIAQNCILVQICKILCLQLQQLDNFLQLVLELYDLLPQYEIHEKVIAIYQQKFNVNIQMFQYLDDQVWSKMIDLHFEDYCIFLIKIGLQQRVRELCLQALKRCKRGEERRVVSRIFQKAKSNGFEQLHNDFIQKSILEERQVVITSQLVERLKEKCIECDLFDHNILL